jgi:hypothetical protein
MISHRSASEFPHQKLSAQHKVFLPGAPFTGCDGGAR